MKIAISLWLSAFILASCVAPIKDENAPYTEGDVKQIITYAPDGRPDAIIIPPNKQITVYPGQGDGISYTNAEGKEIHVQPSYSVEYYR